MDTFKELWKHQIAIWTLIGSLLVLLLMSQGWSISSFQLNLGPFQVSLNAPPTADLAAPTAAPTAVPAPPPSPAPRQPFFLIRWLQSPLVQGLLTPILRWMGRLVALLPITMLLLVLCITPLMMWSEWRDNPPEGSLLEILKSVLTATIGVLVRVALFAGLALVGWYSELLGGLVLVASAVALHQSEHLGARRPLEGKERWLIWLGAVGGAAYLFCWISSLV